MKGFSASVAFTFALDDTFGTELRIASGTMPVGFSGWVTVTSFFHFSGIQILIVIDRALVSIKSYNISALALLLSAGCRLELHGRRQCALLLKYIGYYYQNFRQQVGGRSLRSALKTCGNGSD
jgi:hypothetical protein